MKKTHSTATKIKAKLGFHDVPDMDTVKALTAAHDGLLNNPAYPGPPVGLDTFKAGIDHFSALIIDAEDGGKKAKSAKDKQRVAVIKMYTQLGHSSRPRATTIWRPSTPAASPRQLKQRLRRSP